MSGARTALLALVSIAVATVFLAPELFGGRVLATARLDVWQPWAAHAGTSENESPSFNPDCLTSYYPRRAFLHQAWEDGELPYWNPWTFCGTPFLADPQAQALYPPSWFLLPVDPDRSLGLFVFAHLAGAAFGMALLLRRRNVGTAIAALGGCAFALSGFFAKHLGLPPFLATASWLPWVFLAMEDVVRTPGARAAAVLALAGALTFLAGQPQIAMLIAYAALSAAAVLATTERRGPRHVFRGAVFLVVAGAVAVLIASAQLFPTIELAARSARARLPLETVVSGALHPVEVIRFMVPEFFGSPLTGDEWSAVFPRGDSFYGRIQLNSVFAGTPVFLLAMLGMTHRRTWRRALPFTVVFALFSLVAFGSPLMKALQWLPGMSVGRLDRAGAVVVFAQFVPAALAAAECRRFGTRLRVAAGAVMILLGVGIAWGLGMSAPRLAEMFGESPLGGVGRSGAAAALLERVPGRAGLAALFAAATGVALWLPPRRSVPAIPFALAVLQLFLFAAPYRGDREPAQVFATAPPIEDLRRSLESPGGGYRFARLGRNSGRAAPVSDLLPPSTNVPHRLRDLQGYNALADRRLGETLERATGEPLFSHGIWSGRRIVAPDSARALTHPIFTALSLREVIRPPRGSDGLDRIPAGTAVVPGWLDGQEESGFARTRNPAALPRIRLTPTGRGVDRPELDALLREGSLDPAAEVLWLGEGRAGTAGPPLRPPEVLADERNRILVRTNAEREALLVVADAMDTGWRARLDGEPIRVLPAWGVVRAVVVPAGVHRVEMTYRPPGLASGAALSVLGLCLAFGALALAPPRRQESGT